MKIEIFVIAAVVLVVANGVFVPPRPGNKVKHLLGAKECTWGPSYWCQNLTSAGDCHATKHCIDTVWIHKQLPPDTTTVCQTCLDMVKQARDQLESNETQELIKEVFEGSCALLHIKPVVQECDKICDQYIPDLIDTLASQMNPQIVCSVAGLCNNEKIHRMIADEKNAQNELSTKQSSCNGCHTVVDLMETKFNQLSRDQVLQQLLEICGKMSSFSDACSNIVVTYFTEIYNSLKDNLKSNTVCLISGQCTSNFHSHVAANVEITPISHIGYVTVSDDLPCDLCKQLVGHLRDLLIANTTENEFKLVLQGLCQATQSFKTECLSLVDEYYSIAYNFLLNELNSSEACIMAGICPRTNQIKESSPIVPLLPVKTVPKALLIAKNQPATTDSVKIFQSPELMQLPIERLMPPHTQNVYNSQTCVFCEYLLHYLQQVITNPKTEDEIKQYIDKACSVLPKSVNDTCVGFVQMYEPALVAILAQQIDPSQVCPLIKACPSGDVVRGDVEIFMETDVHDGSQCPLCLFAVTKLEEMVKNQKTESQIKEALTKLCSHLPSQLKQECNDFVDTYTNELVEMLISDFTPQEICVYLKLCTDTSPHLSDNNKKVIVPLSGDTETNVIVDNTVNGEPLIFNQLSSSVTAGPQCVLCEFIMKQLEDQLKDKTTDDDIKKAVHDVCNFLPKTISAQCNGFVNQYADTVIQLLIAAMNPSDICSMMHLCQDKINTVHVEIFDCAVCEGMVYVMEKILDNPKVDHNVEHVLEKTCRALPEKEAIKCQEIIQKYGRDMYALVMHFANKGLICREIGMCASRVSRFRRDTPLLGAKRCTWGPSYWCLNEANAKECGTTKHCQDKVWLGAAPKN